MFHTFYFGCLPLFMSIFWFWFGPLIYDILPSKIDKKKQDAYSSNEKMFNDKYLTQIPNSFLYSPKRNTKPMINSFPKKDLITSVHFDETE